MADILWSDLRMADGNQPGANDVVVVNSDDRLVFDSGASPVTVKGLVVYGEFEVEDGGAPLSLTTDWAVALNSGTFRVGTADNPYEGKFALTLAGKDPENNVDLSEFPDGAMHTMGGMDMGHMSMSHHMIEGNDAFLMAMGDGASIEIHTDDAGKESWTQLNQTANAGDTELHLSAASGWEAGDRIVVASTDFDMNQSEEFTVVGVSNNGQTVTLDRPLEFMHYGDVDTYNDTDGDVHQLDMRAEVGLISRDVVIQGDVDYDDTKALNQQDDQFGGNIMAMNGGEMYISGAELAYMGQAGELGRYPAHWHNSGDVTGQYIENTSVHHSFNKGITVHNTQGAVVSDNVVFETISHNYYLEEKQTYDNVLSGNLGINARNVGEYGEIRGANDDEPSNFYTSNGDNTWTENHAAGSEDKNFYFSLGEEDDWAFGTFEGNAAHSAADRSFYLNHGGLVQDGNPEASIDDPQKVDPWFVDDLTVYKSNGIYVRGVDGTFSNSAFAEMGTNGRFRLNQTIEDSLIVGRSNNTGNPEDAAELEAGRSLPNEGDRTFEGIQLYDGPSGLTNVMFDGFEGADNAVQSSNAVHKTSSFFLEGITWGENVDNASKFDIGTRHIESTTRAFVDVDGSITGTPGAMIYQLSEHQNASRRFNAGEDNEVVEEWGAIITYGQTSGSLRIDVGGTSGRNNGQNHDTPATDLNITRSDGEYMNNAQEQFTVFSDYVYELDFSSIEENFRLYLSDMDWGESATINLGPVPNTASFTLDDPYSDASWSAREVSSMVMLERSPDTAVYRDLDTGEVHIKLVGEMAHGYLWPQPGLTYNNELHSGVTVLVDTEANVDLGNLQYDNPSANDALPPAPYAEGQGPSVVVSEPQPEPQPQPDPEAVDVYFLAGQSNSYRMSGFQSAESYIEDNGLNAIVGHTNQGGTSIRANAGKNDWFPFADGDAQTGELFDEMMAEIQTTLSSESNTNFKALLWAQGEADTNHQGTLHYKEYMQHFIDEVRAVYGEDFTFVILQLSTQMGSAQDDPNWEKIRLIQEELAAENDNVELIDPDAALADAGIDWEDAHQDNVHYSRTGFDALAAAFLEGDFQSPTPTPPANEAPVAGNDTASTAHDTTIAVDVLANDDDPEGSSLTITNVSYDGDTAMVNIVDGEISVNPLNAATNDRTETITYTVADEDGATSTATLTVDVAGAGVEPVPTPTPAPTPAPTPTLDVVLTAVNADDDTIISNIENGGSLTVEDLSTGLNFAATVDSDVGSMVFSLNGGAAQVENFAPYAAFGNNGTDFNGQSLPAGEHALSISVYSEADAGGTLLGEEVFTFTVAEQEPEPDSILDVFIADTNSDDTILSLSDGDVIDADSLGNAHTFYAMTDADDQVDYVTLTFDGQTSTEKVEPYALFGDVGGDFRQGLDLDPGSYNLEVSAYGSDDELLETSQIDFTLI